MKSPYNTRIAIIITLCVCFALVFSCSFRSSGSSIDESLSKIDSLISHQDYNGAWSLLKKVSKTIKNPSETLGVVRRALILNRSEFAKDLLQEALKSSNDNLEILAVYSHMLMGEKKYEEAFTYAKLLEGSQYGSIFAELRFILDEKQLAKENEKLKQGEIPKTIDYYSKEYAQAYADIAYSVGNTGFLRNAALLYTLDGNMQKAFSYHPTVVSSYDTPEFWAQISYDAHMYSRVIDDLQQFDLNDEQLLLLSDAYVHLERIEDAKILWEDATKNNTSLYPSAWHNLALYSQSVGDVKTATESIVHLVNTFPEYIGGLSTYARFSLLDPEMPSNSVFSYLLQERGIQTLQMQDSSTTVTLSSEEAFNKMDSAIQALLLTDENAAMQLVIERLHFAWESSSIPLNDKQKASDVWTMLETYRSDDYGYNTYLVQYAVWFFLSQNMIAEAEGLFSAHCDEHYSRYDEEEDTFTELPVGGMANWEYDYGSYIALVKRDYEKAEQWLQLLIKNEYIGPDVPLSAALNYISLYSAQGKKQQALLMYHQVLEHIRDDYVVATIYYNIAVIEYESGNKSRSINALEQALRYDVNHSAARLLQKKITD